MDDAGSCQLVGRGASKRGSGTPLDLDGAAAGKLAHRVLAKNTPIATITAACRIQARSGIATTCNFPREIDFPQIDGTIRLECLQKGADDRVEKRTKERMENQRVTKCFRSIAMAGHIVCC